MDDEKKVPVEIKFYIEERAKQDRQESLGLFSGKWVEKGATWLLYGIGAIILAGIIKAAAPYLVSTPSTQGVTSGPVIQSSATSTK